MYDHLQNYRSRLRKRVSDKLHEQLDNYNVRPIQQPINFIGNLPETLFAVGSRLNYHGSDKLNDTAVPGAINLRCGKNVRIGCISTMSARGARRHAVSDMIYPKGVPVSRPSYAVENATIIDIGDNTIIKHLRILPNGCVCIGKDSVIDDLHVDTTCSVHIGDNAAIRKLTITDGYKEARAELYGVIALGSNLTTAGAKLAFARPCIDDIPHGQVSCVIGDNFSLLGANIMEFVLIADNVRIGNNCSVIGPSKVELLTIAEKTAKINSDGSILFGDNVAISGTGPLKLITPLGGLIQLEDNTQIASTTVTSQQDACPDDREVEFSARTLRMRPNSSLTLYGGIASEIITYPHVNTFAKSTLLEDDSIGQGDLFIGPGANLCLGWNCENPRVSARRYTLTQHIVTADTKVYKRTQ